MIEQVVILSLYCRKEKGKQFKALSIPSENELAGIRIHPLFSIPQIFRNEQAKATIFG